MDVFCIRYNVMAFGADVRYHVHLVNTVRYRPIFY